MRRHDSKLFDVILLSACIALIMHISQSVHKVVNLSGSVWNYKSNNILLLWHYYKVLYILLSKYELPYTLHVHLHLLSGILLERQAKVAYGTSKYWDIQT